MRDRLVSLGSFERERRTCNLCPKLCHHACPVSNAARDESLTPAAKNGAAGRVAAGMEALGAQVTDLFYACTGCRQCQAHCEHGNDVALSLFAARGEAAAQGSVPEAITQMLTRWDASGNPYGTDLRTAVDSVPESRRVGASGRVAGERKRAGVPPGRGMQVLWPGCATLHESPGLVQRVLAVADILGEADLLLYAGPVQCCGYPLVAAGQMERFRRHVDEAARELRGLRRVVAVAPECAWVMTELWPRVTGVSGPRVVPLINLVVEGLHHLPAGRPVRQALVWHDPCYLGRFLQCYDAPRKVGARVAAQPLQEPRPWTREHGYCSGGGGLLPLTHPEIADRITRARVADLTGESFGPPAEGAVGLRWIVTACPTAAARFRRVGARAVDVVDLVAAFLGLCDLREVQGG